MKQKLNSAVFVSVPDLMQVRRRVKSSLLKNNRKNLVFQSGEQKTFLRTKGMNFEEIRPYQQGDDVRQIDWRVTAKYGRPFTKVYLDETKQSVHFLVDMRCGMHFATEGVFKSVEAASMSTFLAWIFLARQNDVRFHLMKCDTVSSSGVIKGEVALTTFFKELSEASKPMDKKDVISFSRGIHHVSSLLKKGSMLFILSDFHDLSDEDISFLKKMAVSHHLFLIHIYDAIEAVLPKGTLSFAVDGKEIVIQGNLSQQEAYRIRFETLQQRLQKLAFDVQGGYLSVLTRDNYFDILNEMVDIKGLK